MRGGSLTRYYPPDMGGGNIKDLLRPALVGGLTAAAKHINRKRKRAKAPPSGMGGGSIKDTLKDLVQPALVGGLTAVAQHVDRKRKRGKAAPIAVVAPAPMAAPVVVSATPRRRTSMAGGALRRHKRQRRGDIFTM